MDNNMRVIQVDYLGPLDTAEHLESYFSKFGKVTEANIFPKKDLGNGIRWGIVGFDSTDPLNGSLLKTCHFLNGSRIVVKRRLSVFKDHQLKLDYSWISALSNMFLFKFVSYRFKMLNNEYSKMVCEYYFKYGKVFCCMILKECGCQLKVDHWCETVINKHTCPSDQINIHSWCSSADLSNAFKSHFLFINKQITILWTSSTRPALSPVTD